MLTDRVRPVGRRHAHVRLLRFDGGRGSVGDQCGAPFVRPLRAHALRLTAPRGWEVVRYEGEFPSEPSADDLTALAEAVREAGRAEPPTEAVASFGAVAGTGRRGHLRVLPDPSGS